MRTLGNLETEFTVRMQVSTSVAFYTETIIDDWADYAHKWAAGYKKWPFTEGRSSTTFSATEEWNYPEGWKPDSIRLLQIGGKRMKKLDFYHYQTFREEESTNNERVYSDFNNLIFVNPNVDASGTLTAWGQYTPADFDRTDKTATTVFSANGEEGNEAIVEMMISYARLREKNFGEAANHEKLAKEKLEELWKRILDEQYMYQTHPDSGGQWRRFDVLRGLTSNELIKRDQFL